MRRTWQADRLHLLSLGLIFLIGLALRLHFWGVPLRYDEAYTYLRFAHYPPSQFMADYSQPNNHLLHTWLVYFSTQLGGSSEMAIRAPALLAGLAVLGLVYQVGRELYSREAALLATALTAGAALMTDYSTNARGYMPQAALVLGMLWAANRCRGGGDRRFWGLFVLCGALGMYTVPTMLYACAMLASWLGLSIYWEVPPSEQGSYWRAWLLSGAAMVALTLLFYTPILLNNPLSALSSNESIPSLPPGEWLQALPGELAAIFWAWHQAIPPGLTLLGLMGVLVGLYQVGGHIPLILASLAMLPILALQGVFPFVRVWVWLLPLYALWMGAGWAWLGGKIHPQAYQIAGVLLALACAYGYYTAPTPSLKSESAYLLNAPEAYEWLRPQLNADTRLYVYLPSELIMEYYFFRAGEWQVYQEQTRPSFRQTIFILENLTYGPPLPELFPPKAGYSSPEALETLGDARFHRVRWELDPAAPLPLEVQVMQDLAAYQAQGLIFNPRTNPDDLLSFVGALAPLPDSSEEAIIAWRASKAAADLRRAGVKFLLVDSDWLSWLSESEYNQLSDPQQYTLLQEWRDEASGGGFQLYALVE